MQQLFAALTAFVVSLTEAVQAYAEARKEHAKMEMRILKVLNRIGDVVEPVAIVAIEEFEKVASTPQDHEEIRKAVRKSITKMLNKMDGE